MILNSEYVIGLDFLKTKFVKNKCLFTYTFSLTQNLLHDLNDTTENNLF